MIPFTRRRPEPPPPPPPKVTGRACVTCAVTWRSADEACWCCGRPGQLAINVNVW